MHDEGPGAADKPSATALTNRGRSDAVPFVPGQLRQRIREVSARALASGHLQPLQTWGTNCHEGEARFAIRVIDSLARKPRPVPADPSVERRVDSSADSPGERSADSGVRQPRNPFLPYESSLYVSDITDDYVGVLNKYKVVDDHLLLVTKDFVSQTQSLALVDFLALARCLLEFESLGFYNAGMVAGASQPHRHLQLVPLPLDPHGTPVPFWSCLGWQRLPVGQVAHATDLPFRHELVRLAPRTSKDAAETLAESLLRAYELCVKACGWREPNERTPYNFLATRDWLLFVPRCRERAVGISLNAMAFVGGILVGDRSQLEALRQFGCMRALCETAGVCGEEC